MLYPAAIPALALAAGIAGGIFLPIHGHLSPIIAGVATAWIAALLALLQRRPDLFVAEIALGFMLAGGVLGSSASRAALQPPLSVLFDRLVPPPQYQISAYVEGTVKADSVRTINGASLSVDVDQVEIGGERYDAPGGVVMNVGGQPAQWRIESWRAGRRVRVPASLRRPAKYLDQGVPDAQRDAAWKGTILTGSVKSDRLVEIVATGSRLSEWLAACRASIRRSVSAAVGGWSERSSAVVAAILIGDRTGLDEDLQRTLQEAGTYHVVAISGGNIAILAALCILIFRTTRAGAATSALAVMAILTIYALIVGVGASVVRATLMAVIYLAAQLGDQRSSPGNVAALAAAAMFCLNPLEVVDASFALTFGATLGLVIGMPRVPHLRAMSKWMSPAAALFAASVCAEVALLPVSALVFSRVTAAGLLLNFAAIPLMAVVQLAGMAAVALTHVSLYAAMWVGVVAHLGVAGLLWSGSLVDLAPWAVRRVPPPAFWIVAAYYGALIVALNAQGSARWLGTLAVAVCAWWIVAAPAPANPLAPGLLRVTFLDVGQGDAAVVQFPDGRSLSIDEGGVASGSFDIGARVVAPAYWALGLRQLDYMSISHGDPDHIGGAPSVLRDFRPSEVWEGVPVPTHAPAARLRLLADERGAVWRTLQTNDALSVGGVRLIVRHPPLPEWERQRVRNDDSEVIELAYGGVSVVFTGDIGADVERSIGASFERRPIRILKVPHHGSATSSSFGFLRALHPDIAVFSVGRGNPFGHPAPDVLNRYRAAGAAIYRTDRDGAVTMETDGRTVRVRTFTDRRLTLRTTGR